MLNIIVLILKVIGIILVVLLGLIAAAALIVFLVPVRYKAALVKTEDNLCIEARAGWLFHIVGLYFKLEGKVKRIRLRILFIVIYDSARIKKIKKNNKKKIKTVSKKDTGSDNQQDSKLHKDIVDDTYVPQQKDKDDKENIIDEKTLTDNNDLSMADGSLHDEEISSKEVPKGKEPECDDKIKNDRDKELEDGLKNDEDKDDAQGVFGRIKNKLYQRYSNILGKLKAVLKKIKAMMQNIEKLKMNLKTAADMFWTEERKKLYSKTLKLAKKMFRHVMPGKIRGNVVFGTGEPYFTGQVFTYLGMLYGIYGKYLTISADFEEKRIEADVKLKGRIRFGTLMILLLRIYNRDLRKLIKDVKNVKNIF